MAKLQIFNRVVNKVSGFLMAYRLYIRMRIRETTVKKQIQWILSCVQRGLADIWKENIIENLKSGELEYVTIGEFLIGLKKEFGGGDNETIRVVELKKIEQGS